ncbi:helix-turn-helix domain-containing protein [Brucella pituitosa]|uniref:helix-turn-helix domain-containing protein n=1 Tax=Brucella pituitosa TaxID=571256 RepID=UPI003F4AB7BC
MLTADQVRAARAFLKWKQSDLATRSGLSEETIKRIEKLGGPLLSVNASTLHAIENAFKASGIQFINAPDREGIVRVLNKFPK